MKKFLELIEKTPELKAKIDELNKAPKATPADFIALAKEYGIALTEADFVPAKAEEISEEELTAVAGGKMCACTFGGGGEASHRYEKPCACVMGGGGEWIKMENGSVVGIECRCACVAAGYGDNIIIE